MERELITEEEKRELEEELHNLKEVERKDVIEQLKVARSFGDLKENEEYESARKKQGVIESKISEVEMRLKRSEIVNTKEKHVSVVHGSVVTAKIDGKQRQYSIGRSYKDAVEISAHSPIAEALMSKKVGDKIKARVPKGEITIEIKGII